MAEKSTEQYIEEGAALEKILETIREFLTVKITLPLGNTAFKELHTNSFIWIPLLDYMDVANYEDIIAFYMRHKTSTARGNNYIRDRWYIESITINNDNGKFQAELELNPLASGNKEYFKNRTDFQKAFTDAINGTATSTYKGSSVASTSSSNSTLTGGQGTTIDNLVKNIVGTETDQLKKAKAIHEWLKKEVSYKRYCCCKYPNNPEKAYNNRKGLNCGDTAILTCSMMKSAGLNAYIVHRDYNGGHFWTIIEINGKKYASDKTGSGVAFNTVWSRSGRANTSITDYAHRESGLSCGCEAYSC